MRKIYYDGGGIEVSWAIQTESHRRPHGRLDRWLRHLALGVLYRHRSRGPIRVSGSIAIADGKPLTCLTLSRHQNRSLYRLRRRVSLFLGRDAALRRLLAKRRQNREADSPYPRSASSKEQDKVGTAKLQHHFLARTCPRPSATARPASVLPVTVAAAMRGSATMSGYCIAPLLRGSDKGPSGCTRIQNDLLPNACAHPLNAVGVLHQNGVAGERCWDK